MIDLIFFDGCPHANAARDNVRDALVAAGLPAVWREHNQSHPDLAAEWRRFPSPTVLINGVDVEGASTATGGACRLQGAPTVEAIVSALAGWRGKPPVCGR